MFGEFTASMIAKDNDKFVSSDAVGITSENRFLYPNYLSPVNFDCKTFPWHTKWSITDSQIEELHLLYGDKSVCLPTHWYSNQLSNARLPCYGITLYSTDTLLLRLAFSLFWIKSHVYANDLWKSREQELQSLIDANHKYADKLKELQLPNQYRNWKYLAYRYDMLKDNNIDLYHYMTRSYGLYQKNNLLMRIASPDWFKVDIGNLLHGEQSNMQLLEDHLKITLNKNYINEYTEKNLNLLYTALGFTLDDLSSPKWLDTLYDYCKSKMID